MNYGYIRVSTDKQTVENQRHEINCFCQQQGLSIDGWIEETISGTKGVDKRKLGRLLRKVQAGDLIICAELSRQALARMRDEGVVLGRPAGALNKKYRLDGQEKKIYRMLEQGIGKREIARQCKVSPKTLYRWLRVKGAM